MLDLWDGPDGRSVLAAFNPGPYDGAVYDDLSADKTWISRVQRNGKVSGLFTDYHYYGTGDIGGAAREPSVKLLEAIITQRTGIIPPPRNKDEEYSDYEKRIGSLTGPQVRVGNGPLHVVSSTAEQMFLDILKTNHTAALPHYSGDLLLIEHSAGSLTSQAYHKRWNRKNELLADAAERASVAAAWLGGRPYPQQRLNDAWTLVMGGQFHDIMAGTATPQAYDYSWNDDVLAMNQFAGVLTSAASAVASALDTQTKGMAVVVFNPLNIEREDVVEANVKFPRGTPRGSSRRRARRKGSSLRRSTGSTTALQRSCFWPKYLPWALQFMTFKPVVIGVCLHLLEGHRLFDGKCSLPASTGSEWRRIKSPRQVNQQRTSPFPAAVGIANGKSLTGPPGIWIGRTSRSRRARMFRTRQDSRRGERSSSRRRGSTSRGRRFADSSRPLDCPPEMPAIAWRFANAIDWKTARPPSKRFSR